MFLKDSSENCFNDVYIIELSIFPLDLSFLGCFCEGISDRLGDICKKI